MSGQGCIKWAREKMPATKDVAMTGTGLSKLFDVQNNQFTVVYCKKCGYSEFYNKKSSTASNILDLFFS